MTDLLCPVCQSKVGRADPGDSGYWWCRRCKVESRFEVDAVGYARVVDKPVLSVVG